MCLHVACSCPHASTHTVPLSLDRPGTRPHLEPVPSESPADLGVEKLMMSGLQSHSMPAVVPSWASGIQLPPVLDSEAYELPSCLSEEFAH